MDLRTSSTQLPDTADSLAVSLIREQNMLARPSILENEMIGHRVPGRFAPLSSGLFNPKLTFLCCGIWWNPPTNRKHIYSKACQCHIIDCNGRT